MDTTRICVVLVSARNPLNIGAAARAMCNFGFDRLRVVNPYDAAFREARSAVGATDVLTNAEEFTTVAEAVADCTLVVGTTAMQQRHLAAALETLPHGAPLIDREILRAPGARVAILFGSEKFGLSNDDLSYCHWLMHVPTGAEQPSMNLGQAVAVCLYELVRAEGEPARADLKTPRFDEAGPATSEDLERTTSVLLETLYASGYMQTRPSNDKEQTVRRLMRRLNLSSEDSTVWMGMLRQIAWKLRQKE